MWIQNREPIQKTNLKINNWKYLHKIKIHQTKKIRVWKNKTKNKMIKRKNKRRGQRYKRSMRLQIKHSNIGMVSRPSPTILGVLDIRRSPSLTQIKFKEWSVYLRIWLTMGSPNMLMSNFSGSIKKEICTRLKRVMQAEEINRSGPL